MSVLPASSTHSHIVFKMSNDWYALPVSQVRAVERWRQPTPVPGTPPAILGIVNQRGRLITVIDARLLLGLEVKPTTRSTRLLLAEVGDVELALVADEVADLLPLDSALVEPPPAHAALFCDGLAATPFGTAVLLDLAALVNATKVGA